MSDPVFKLKEDKKSFPVIEINYNNRKTIQR